ncbi:SagB/ThcOx family dehydrogenase [Robertmurraya mangrovi]|nr:SagB/ThcOx family dehydrogenase [Bacillus sp. 31A1R]
MLRTRFDLCDEFLKETSYSLKTMDKDLFKGYDPAKRPETYLTYPEAAVQIKLGKPDFSQYEEINLWKLLGSRRSKRNFVEQPLSLNELNILLWGTQGITADMGDYQLRTSCSAGALFPIETYLLINFVEGVQPGLYHLNVKDWILEGLKIQDVSDFAFTVTDHQEMAKVAGVNFVWTAMLERTRAKYKERAYRYILWDAGHVSQNLHTVANGMGLGVCTMGHWYDVEMNEFLGINGKEHMSILMASVGKINGVDWKEDRRPPKI